MKNNFRKPVAYVTSGLITICLSFTFSVSSVFAGDQVEISFADMAATEVEDVGTVVLDVEISDPGDCSVNVVLDGGLTTALLGGDFNYTDPSPIVFTAGGPTVYSIDILVFDDLEPESSEDVVFNLADVTGGCILVAPSTYTLTITDNDFGAATVAFVNEEDVTVENAATFPVTINLSESADCTVDLVLNTGLTNATEGIDFTFTDPSPILFISGGPVTQTFDVGILDDAAVESTEDIVFDLSAAAGCVLGTPAQTTLHITDNDNVGITDPVTGGMEIFNSGNIVTINLNTPPVENTQLQITDTEGRDILHQTIVNQQTVISLEALPASAYIVRVLVNGQYYQKKIVVGN